MTTITEALRLAEKLDEHRLRYGETVYHQTAAELRRLSIENEALGLHLSERMKDLARVEAQRDALLEFAKYVEAIDPNNPAPLFEKARAAIKAVEEQK